MATACKYLHFWVNKLFFFQWFLLAFKFKVAVDANWDVYVKTYERYFITSEPDKDERENDKQFVESCYCYYSEQKWIIEITNIACFLFSMIKP